MFLRVSCTPDCDTVALLVTLLIVIESVAQPHGAVSSGQETAWWLCLAEDKALWAERSLSKGLQCKKGGRSTGSAQRGLKDVVGQGEKNGQKGGNECVTA